MPRPVHVTLRGARGALDLGVTALAGVTAAGLGLAALRPGAAVHPHWMGTTGTPALDSALAAAFAVLVLLPAGVAAGAPRAVRAARVVVGTGVLVLAVTSLVRHGLAFSAGSLRPTGWAPPATLVAAALVLPWTLRAALGAAPPRSPPRRLARAVGVVVGGTALVLGHVLATGATDYRAPADAVLVLGAKVGSDGRPSGALLDRTRTACALLRAGLVRTLVLSGGRGPGTPVGEPEVMRDLARAEGVPDEALVLDASGVDTASSVRFMAHLARERGWTRVLAVSHDYHLARIRLLAAGEGLALRTVPAEETQPSGWKAYATAREVVAYAATWVLGG